MSYTYLQEQGEESLVESFVDIPQFVLSRLNLTAEKSYSKDSEMESYQSSQSGTMCKPSMETRGEEKLISSAEDFHAKTYQQQEKEQELKDQDQVCGNTWRESSVKFDLNTHSWKTHQCLWDEDLAPSSLTLPKWGMMQSGVLWERITSPLHTDETESGFWPTPRAQEPGRTSEGYGRGLAELIEGKSQVQKKWPTPTCADATMGAILNDNTKLIMLKSGKLRKISNQGVSGSIGLARTVAMYPTPSANEDAAGTPNGKMQKMLGNSPLIRGTTPEKWNGGTLNPTWVEWLMGWPLGSTDLKPLAMDKFLLWLNSHGKY